MHHDRNAPTRSDALEVITEHEANTAIDPSPELLTRGEVARRFGVAPQTVARWARQGILPSVRTLGGQRRYPAEAVRRLVSESMRTVEDFETPSGATDPAVPGAEQPAAQRRYLHDDSERAATR